MTTQLSAPNTPTRAEPVRERRAGLSRRIFLGGPNEPRWARPTLWGVLALAALLYTWSLSSAGMANSYYSAAVLSGTKSWKAFFFGSLDAGLYITVDKPPMALWVMGLSARIFGFSTWSLLLPQAAAGVASVGVLYTTVRRAVAARAPDEDGDRPPRGAPQAAGLLAALVLTLTPITVAINRDNNPDTVLVLLLVLAAWALQRAIDTGRLRPLLLCAFFVGCAFNTKMLQGFVVLPGFALVYLICAPSGFGRRIARLLAAGAVLVLSSAWWMVIVDQLPATDKPYIGGSVDGTVWDLVIGYNGLGRIFGRGGGGGPGIGGNGANFGGTAGVGRLFNDILAGQISWLIPFAAIALVTGVLLLRRRPRTDLTRAALLLWGGWVALHFLVFSFAKGTFHPYYSTAMAPAIGALVGMGGVLMFQAHRRSSGWWWVLPFALAVTGAWSFTLLRRTPDWNPWLAWTVVAVTALAVVGLVGARLLRRSGPALTARLLTGAVIVALVGGLAGPTAYAASAAASQINGTNPTAGPASGRMGGGPMGGPGRMGGMGGPGRMGGGPDGTTDSKMVDYLVKNLGGARWLVAVDNAHSASSIILSTGKPVIAMGGFMGSDPAMTVAKLQRYVKEGSLHYLLLGGGGVGGGRGGNSDITSWVQQNCTVVKASEYGGTSASGAAAGDSGSTGQQLYRCGD